MRGEHEVGRAPDRVILGRRFVGEDVESRPGQPAVFQGADERGHVSLRADQAVASAPHDTRIWIKLAKDKAAFKPVGSIFEQVEPLWQAGLLQGF